MAISTVRAGDWTRITHPCRAPASLDSSEHLRSRRSLRAGPGRWSRRGWTATCVQQRSRGWGGRTGLRAAPCASPPSHFVPSRAATRTFRTRGAAVECVHWREGLPGLPKALRNDCPGDGANGSAAPFHSASRNAQSSTPRSSCFSLSSNPGGGFALLQRSGSSSLGQPRRMLQVPRTSTARLVRLGTLCALGLVSTALAQGGFYLRVLVRDLHSDELVRGATVWLTPAGGKDGGTSVAVERAYEPGFYDFGFLPVDTYRVHIEKDGYFFYEWRGIRPDIDAGVSSILVPVTLVRNPVPPGPTWEERVIRERRVPFDVGRQAQPQTAPGSPLLKDAPVGEWVDCSAGIERRNGRPGCRLNAWEILRADGGFVRLNQAKDLECGATAEACGPMPERVWALCSCSDAGPTPISAEY